MVNLMDVKNISFSYDNNEDVFNNISFSINKGDISHVY